MTRQQKYPETRTFHYYNANPRNRKGCDCVVRAICTALGQSWEQTVRELTELGIKHGYLLNDPSLFPKYLESKGWIKKPQPRKSDNTKYTGVEFCHLTKESIVWAVGYDFTRIVANLGGNHTVAIIDGKVWDIWDSTDGCIGNYWVKPE